MNGIPRALLRVYGRADDLLLHNNLIWARDDLHYAIKLNATGTNITTTHNVAVGKTQGEPEANNYILGGCARLGRVV